MNRDLHAVPPEYARDVADGCDNWWAEYKKGDSMSSATENGRISLKDNLQFRWFDQAMKTLSENYDHLSEFDRRLYNDLIEGFRLAGRDMTITRRQMNHIKTSAASYEAGA